MAPHDLKFGHFSRCQDQNGVVVRTARAGRAELLFLLMN